LKDQPGEAEGNHNKEQCSKSPGWALYLGYPEYVYCSLLAYFSLSPLYALWYNI